jgi:hypothetical protein
VIVVKEGKCDIPNCKEKAIGWKPLVSEDNNIVGRINFCMNHKKELIDEFHISLECRIISIDA